MRTSSITEDIASADARLKDVGLPTYSQLAGALRALMNYTGGWDKDLAHPCGKAARVLSRLDDSGSIPEQLGSVEYTSAMGEAAQRYIEECCRLSDGRYAIMPPSMPGSFRWEALFERMMDAFSETVDSTPVIDLKHVSYDRILDTYSKAYPDLPLEVMANDIVGHVCELVERSAAQEDRDAGEKLERQLADVHPLPKEKALEKWDGFKDRAIEGGFGSQQERVAGLIKAGATRAKLIQFWRETKHLNWANSYGQSPWETASSVGAALDAALLGGALSAYHRGLVYVFDRTQAAASAGLEQHATQKNDQRRLKM
ncbi:hypothetical protein [Cupriavidus taiwanensis]|uniref:Uncharacterized protein n=1 Tax=Cupriavidus taiwanensis TaxID=164546 RepID=A0A7Z7NQ54_9BURK|nr:hypothetical protein [Cupriavidus taiwanensis]SOZ17209.1 hypothetical protein CBM2597_U10086 [Cupriavidus taiwanensis]SOZ96464.1 hypothetical protein CBM2598_U10263 [Cupriavidus taiwanensis]SPC25592.1 hypothetical protein CBM2594_U10093 [Cupriavidus taiwanensis]